VGESKEFIYLGAFVESSEKKVKLLDLIMIIHLSYMKLPKRVWRMVVKIQRDSFEVVCWEDRGLIR
jgi:hypothetical protein